MFIMHKKVIFFDFDGTIIESNIVKEKGFLELYKNENLSTLKAIIVFHRSNMGLNRFEKFKYINENIINKKYNNSIGSQMNKQYSDYVKKKIEHVPFVKGAIRYLDKNYNKFNFYLCSVTIHSDLLSVIEKKNLIKYFKEIRGGPEKKLTIIQDIVNLNKYNLDDILYVGDAESDYKLAKKLKVSLIGVKSIGSFLFSQNIKVVDNLMELESLI